MNDTSSETAPLMDEKKLEDDDVDDFDFDFSERTDVVSNLEASKKLHYQPNAKKGRISITNITSVRTDLLADKISRVERSWYALADRNRIGAGESF